MQYDIADFLKKWFLMCAIEGVKTEVAMIKKIQSGKNESMSPWLFGRKKVSKKSDNGKIEVKEDKIREFFKPMIDKYHSEFKEKNKEFDDKDIYKWDCAKFACCLNNEYQENLIDVIKRNFETVGENTCKQMQDRTGFKKSLTERVASLHKRSCQDETSEPVLEFVRSSKFACFCAKEQRLSERKKYGFEVYFSEPEGSEPTGIEKAVVKNIMEEKTIDQRHLWMNPECAVQWEEITEDSGYATYQACHNSLKALVHEKDFKDAITNPELIENVVMLGGGGARAKDEVMLEALRTISKDQSKKIGYIVLDMSPFMIENARSNVTKQKKSITGKGPGFSLSHVEERYIKSNFFHLEDVQTEIKNSDESRTLFMMTGGTFGNINEEDFLKSLNKIVIPGDLLVIAVSHYTGQWLNVNKDSSDSSYYAESIKGLLLPILSNIITHDKVDGMKPKKPAGIINDIWKSKKSEPVPDESSCFSNTKKRSLVLKVGNITIEALKQSVYQTESLKSGMKEFGWDLVCYTAEGDVGKDGCTFNQFMFMKKPDS